MIDWRKHHWAPFVVTLVYFAWLFAMSRIGLAGLALIGEDLWLRLIWLLVISTLAFGPPIYLLRRLVKRLNRTR